MRELVQIRFWVNCLHSHQSPSPCPPLIQIRIHTDVSTNTNEKYQYKFDKTLISINLPGTSAERYKVCYILRIGFECMYVDIIQGC